MDGTKAARTAFGEVGNKLHAITNKAIKPLQLPKKNDKPLIKAKPSLRSNNITTRSSISYSTRQLEEVLKIDISDDPQLVHEYVEDIIVYLRKLEQKHQIDHKFLANSKVTPKMRSILVNWMCDLRFNFGLIMETFLLAVSITDTYLHLDENVNRETLQLVGVTSLFIASKYEEVTPYDIVDFKYVCDNAYSKKKILQMEREILSRLEFNLGKPLSVHFLRRFSKAASVNTLQHSLAKFILELCLFYHQLSHLKPSLQAAAALYLAIAVLKEKDDPTTIWTRTVQHHSSYTFSDIRSTVGDFAVVLINAESSKFKTVKNVYEKTLNRVSPTRYFKGAVVQKLATRAQIVKLSK